MWYWKWVTPRNIDILNQEGPSRLYEKLATGGKKGGKFKSLILSIDFLKHIVTYNGMPWHFMSFPIWWD